MLSFVVNNANDTFSTSDFKRKTPIKIVLAWSGIIKNYIYYVVSAKPSDTTLLNETISVKAVDWLGLALLDILRQVPVEQNKRVEEAAISLLALTPVQPTISFQAGIETFPLVFGNIRNGTSTLYSELYNLIVSELGYMYLKSNEVLVIENHNSRTTFLPLSSYTYDLAEKAVGFALNDVSGYLLTDDGGKIIVDDATTATFDASFPRPIEIVRTEGENVLNKIVVQVFPSQVDFSIGSYYQLYTYNLYNENPPITIPAGATISIEGSYPESVTNKIPDAAIDVQTPATEAISNYGFSLGPTGKANLVHSFVAGGDSWKWTITNNNATAGDITFIELFGRPIFNQQPLSDTVEDTTSQEDYGPKSLRIDLPYRQAIGNASQIIENMLDEEKDSKLRVESISFCANLDQNNMANFMLTDLGDLRYLHSDSLVIDGFYHVNGMKIKVQPPKGPVYVQYKLKETEAIYPLALQFSGQAGSKNIVSTISPPAAISDLPQKTISLWVYIKTAIADASLINKFNANSGWSFHLISGINCMQFRQFFSGSSGIWRTPNNSMSGLVGAWHHLAVTYDDTSTANVPIIYIDNSSQTLSTILSPTGTVVTDAGLNLHIGNTNYSGFVTPSDFNGLFKDIRIYNRILSAGEITTLYNQQNSYLNLNSGLVFNVPFVRYNRYLSEYVGFPIESDMKIIDYIGKVLMQASYNHSSVNNAVKGNNASLTSY
jgi:hypothetical protein